MPKSSCLPETHGAVTSVAQYVRAGVFNEKECADILKYCTKALKTVEAHNAPRPEE